jgi:hypothetical protein
MYGVIPSQADRVFPRQVGDNHRAMVVRRDGRILTQYIKGRRARDFIQKKRQEIVDAMMQ